MPAEKEGRAKVGACAGRRPPPGKGRAREEEAGGKQEVGALSSGGPAQVGASGGSATPEWGTVVNNGVLLWNQVTWQPRSDCCTWWIQRHPRTCGWVWRSPPSEFLKTIVPASQKGKEGPGAQNTVLALLIPAVNTDIQNFKDIFIQEVGGHL